MKPKFKKISNKRYETHVLGQKVIIENAEDVWGPVWRPVINEITYFTSCTTREDAFMASFGIVHHLKIEELKTTLGGNQCMN